MNQIKYPLELVKTILPIAKIEKNIDYRKSIYCFDIDLDNGRLLYNSLTNELLFVNNDEDVKEELIKRYFLVPVDFDEIKLCNEVKDILNVMSKKKDYITSFTILPTTNCNARCFYCYEYDVKKIDMSKETAIDVVKFIKEQSNNEQVSIEWFGGEPLFNVEIIDIISKELNKLNIKFSSSMVTNGYLFDEGLIKRCKELWNIKHIQITLDGTKEEYNKIKSYIYDDLDPYTKVINNIKLLTDNKIYVSIRLNMTASNFNNLKDLCDELKNTFKDNKYLSVYSASIGQYNSPNRFKEYHEEESNKEEYKTLLDKTSLFKTNSTSNCLSEDYKDYYCKADLDTSVIILPDGRLSLCEHFLDSETCGDIYKGLDRSVKETWKKKVNENRKECETCVLYPICNLPVKCPANIGGCTYEYKNTQLRLLKERILNTYKRSKK